MTERYTKKIDINESIYSKHISIYDKTVWI